MIPILAWRNVWRSRTRSLVVISAVAIGIWALLFLLGFSQGMMSSYIESAIENQTSHLQIHDKDFQKDKEVKFFMENSDALMNSLSKNEDVESATLRSLSMGMVATAKGARGVSIRGVNPKEEAQVSRLDTKIIEGEYLSDKGRNSIIIGKSLAEKLKTKLRKKVVLTFQDVNNNQIQAAFRVTGIYTMGNAKMDEAFVYVRNSDLNRLLGIEKGGHEIAILTNDIDEVDLVVNNLKSETDTSKVAIEPYYVISPELNLFNEQMGASTGILTAIIMLALIFGIINTMLMAVLERTKELGMLMAIGMNKGKVFLTIVFETLLLSIIGAPIGMLLGWLTITMTNRTGIDLLAYQKGLDQFNMSGMVYPSLTLDTYLTVAFAVFLTALIASIYPASKAVKLKPVEAMRKI